ncbi:hypothetical protein GL267_003095 [Acidithiobacillus ferrianus]|uniref:DUF559 domain-containing protein n=2 Tax=Acidithiobacillus ferrianus TaxID=2678518 RepID=A0A845UFH7_9PROT|nr:hypothetical protein [Acidithiobacillus ferrianus]NDU43340.1 hypothetical protein [Acidithiobacillus ferrianus]
MDKEKRRAQVREAKRIYREKMRAAGYREIIVWATPAQAEKIREMVKGNTPPP